MENSTLEQWSYWNTRFLCKCSKWYIFSSSLAGSSGGVINAECFPDISENQVKKDIRDTLKAIKTSLIVTVMLKVVILLIGLGVVAALSTITYAFIQLIIKLDTINNLLLL